LFTPRYSWNTAKVGVKYQSINQSYIAGTRRNEEKPKYSRWKNWSMIISHLDKVDCIPFRIGHETMVCIDTLYYQISNKMTELYLLTKHKGFVMVVGFTTTYAISSYQHVVSSNLDQGEVYNFLSVTCDRSVVFSGSSGFLHQKNWPPRYNWNIVESGVKHHQTNRIGLETIVCIELYVISNYMTELYLYLQCINTLTNNVVNKCNINQS
jgi:hypothetical protein